MKNVSMTRRIVSKQLKTDFIRLEKSIGRASMLIKTPSVPITVCKTPSNHHDISTYLQKEKRKQIIVEKLCPKLSGELESTMFQHTH